MYTPGQAYIISQPQPPPPPPPPPPGTYSQYPPGHHLLSSVGVYG